MKLWWPIRANWCTADSPEMIALSSIVTWPASCTTFDRITLFPIWQSCAMCTYDISRQFLPTVVLNEWAVPRLIVAYSRITVPSPISTVRPSCELEGLRGATHGPDPIPTLTPGPASAFARGSPAGPVHASSPTAHPLGPTIAYAPIPPPCSARARYSASGEITLGRGGLDRRRGHGLGPPPPLRPRRPPRRRLCLTPLILQTVPLSCTTSSSKRSWSPGLTGRRNFTLSSDMK